LAKKGAAKAPTKTWITEGGLKQAWVKKRKAERAVKGTEMGGTLKWNRKALLNYIQCRTGKGRLGMWGNTLDPWEDPTCSAMNWKPANMWHCIYFRGVNWEEVDPMDGRKVWMRKRQEGEKEVIVDLVEDFFTNFEPLSYLFDGLRLQGGLEWGVVAEVELCLFRGRFPLFFHRFGRQAVYGGRCSVGAEPSNGTVA